MTREGVAHVVVSTLLRKSIVVSHGLHPRRCIRCRKSKRKEGLWCRACAAGKRRQVGASRGLFV